MNKLIIKSFNSSIVNNFEYHLSDEYLDFDSKVLCNPDINEELKIKFLKKDFEQEKPKFLISQKCACINESKKIEQLIRVKLIEAGNQDSSYKNYRLFNFVTKNNLSDASKMISNYLLNRDNIERKSKYKDSSIPSRLFELGEYDKAIDFLETLVNEVLNKESKRIDDGVNDLSNNPFAVLHSHDSENYRNKVEDLAFKYYWSVSKGLTSNLHDFLQTDCKHRYIIEYKKRLNSLISRDELDFEIMKSRRLLGPSLGIDLWHIYKNNISLLNEDGIENSLFLAVDIAKNKDLTDNDRHEIIAFILKNHPTISDNFSTKNPSDFDRYLKAIYALYPSMEQTEFEKLIPVKYNSSRNFKEYKKLSNRANYQKDDLDSIKQSIEIVKKYNSSFDINGEWDIEELYNFTNKSIWFGSVDTSTPMEFRNIFTTHFLPYLINLGVLNIDLTEDILNNEHLISILTPKTKFIFKEQPESFNLNMTLLIQSLNLALTEVNNINRFTFIDTGDENLMVILLPISETEILINETGLIKRTDF
ncbi:hypothetical protein [Cellulophaga sp. Z1A5H]|uniref:hypothetical protein n=1 Tax=Cellulophaga sp. Z1A5H TaxID=2687291 RepID=UPI0013FD88FE|nr:hypothetical protein [Cellulophaga sp. Z1A5H]